ncbi:YppE family protein [Metabacillus halosaccharovorans]|uniref:YppE family protein n=1 Tax=Metabacillus halosaccharovorans TaxID=930124 RepID=UPI001C2011B5|nr:YppE family protein [Metabacillus halosaccharovorans]
MSYINLIKSSLHLLKCLTECKHRFDSLQTKPEKTEIYFYEQVKPTFELVKHTANAWEQHALDWIKMEKPKYIHQTQIESAMENIEQVVLQSFYKDVNKQRFHNLHHSVEYVLNTIMDEIEKKDASQ